MPYVGHNVYGRRAQDYSVRTGIIDEPGFSDVWCELCWWAEFESQLPDGWDRDHRGHPNWGGAHGELDFYWWPARMMGNARCRVCGLDYGADTERAVAIEAEHRASMQERFREGATA